MATTPQPDDELLPEYDLSLLKGGVRGKYYERYRSRPPANGSSMRIEQWQSLRVGDRIRFVAMPTGFSLSNCHSDTLKAYQTLIDRRRPVRVYRLDEWAMPWIQFRVRRPNGKWEYHSLLINHDGWVRVRPRNTGARPIVQATAQQKKPGRMTPPGLPD